MTEATRVDDGGAGQRGAGGLAHAARRPFILRRSLKLRIVLVFVLLAVALMLLFWQGAQRVVAVGWREAARPLLTDYVDHLAADIVVDGRPRVARAEALVQRLPLTVEIRGPQVNWSSHPDQTSRSDRALRLEQPTASAQQPAPAGSPVADGPQNGRERPGWAGVFRRSTADGHEIRFGIDREVFGSRPPGFLIGFVVLAGLTFLAWLYVRRQLFPLDAIGAGAARFGQGDFSHPIPARWAARPDELGRLASTVNIMGEDIRQMLDAKRALLLAISHELRSPLTRARLHAELLPEDDPAVQPQRAALMRDLQEMSRLITDLLESERLAGRHAALQREPVALPVLVASVRNELISRYPHAADVRVYVDTGFPVLPLDAVRMRLMLRNLLDNALRHGMPPSGAVIGSSCAPSSTAEPSSSESAASDFPEVRLERLPDGGVLIAVRDVGPGVDEDQIPQLAQAFHRPDRARTRRAGGVGLGMYLCRLVAEAHGGRFSVSNAHPGLRVQVWLPDARATEAAAERV